MLAKIAVIIDYYKLYEVLEIVAPLWFKALKAALSNSPGRDITLWILVSWVFRDASILKQITRVAILWSKKDITILHELPIPLAIIGKF